MSKHTKGKWEVSAMYNGNDLVGHRIVVDGYQLAHCRLYGDMATSDETLANARLIASAPELLEALKQIADDKGDADFTIVEIKKIACNAIALAEKEGE